MHRDTSARARPHTRARTHKHTTYSPVPTLLPTYIPSSCQVQSATLKVAPTSGHHCQNPQDQRKAPKRHSSCPQRTDWDEGHAALPHMLLQNPCHELNTAPAPTLPGEEEQWALGKTSCFHHSLFSAPECWCVLSLLPRARLRIHLDAEYT